MFLIEKRPMGVLHLFSVKNIFHDKMDFRLFYFHVTIVPPAEAEQRPKSPHNLDASTSALVYIFSSILNQSFVNKKN